MDEIDLLTLFFKWKNISRGGGAVLQIDEAKQLVS